MQKATSFDRATTDLDWLRRSQLTNRCLLIIGVIASATVGLDVGLRLDGGELASSAFQLALLIGIVAWLLVAYFFSRARRYRVAGWLTVALVLAVVAVALYLLPIYQFAVLPLAALPVALAALLLSRRAIVSTVLAAAAVIVGADFAAAHFPPPDLGLHLPPPTAALAIYVALAMLVLLAILLAPLRGEIARGAALLRGEQTARSAAEQRRQEADSQRAAAYEQLDSLRRNYTSLVHKLTDGAIVVDDTGVVRQANPTAQAIWAEVADDTLVGQRFEHVRVALAGSSAAAQFVEIVELPASVHEPMHITHVLLDRRERARLARLRSELMSLLADEMRNPLTSMVTALEMTLGQNLPEGADRVLVGARRSGQRLLDLVTTMLEIDQLENDPASLQRTAISIRPILDAGIAQTAPLQHQGAVTVVVEYSGDGLVLGDGDRLRRAFVHLLEHAIRQSPPYSTVNVRTEAQETQMLVRVSDQGPGLTAQQRASLFDQRATPGERTMPALGLAFSKLVVETHGGRLFVEHSGSQGSTYLFTLPLAPRSEKGASTG